MKPTQRHPHAPRATLPRRARQLMMALEPRVMFDAALASTADAVATKTTADHPVADGGKDASSVAALATTAAAPQTAKEIVFVDPSAPDWQQLVSNTRSGVQVVVLDASKDGIAQINAALAGQSGVSAVHLVSHGSDGMIMLGNTRVDSATLSQRSTELGALASHLAVGADVLIYGCDVAQTADGQHFVDQLSQLLHADVAASKDATGAAAMGGNWVLEYATGAIESKAFITDAGKAQYQDVMSTIDLSGKTGWTAVMYGVNQDPIGDSQAGAADTDIVGDANHGSLYVAFDDNGTATTSDDTVAFRMRIGNPTSTTYFGGVAVVGIDANRDGKVDLFTAVDGRNNGQVIRLLDPGTGLNNSPNTTSTSPLPTGWIASNGVYAMSASNYSVVAVSSATDPHWNGNANIDGGNTGTDVFVSWRISISDLSTVLAKASPVDRSGTYGPRGSTGIAGYNKDTVVQYVNFTQTQTGPINGDLNGVGASYDKNATFSSLGAMTAPMSAANPVSASLAVTISEPIGDGNLSASESTSVTLSGTTNAAAGSTINLTIADTSGSTSDVTATATVVAGAGGVNTWSVSGVNLSSQVDGTLTVTARITSGTDSAMDTATVALDKTAPVITVSAVATAGTPTISGTSDLSAGSLITVTLDTDNNASTANVSYQTLVQSGGGWSINTATATPSSGTAPTGGYSSYTKVTASGTDAAGNTGSAIAITKPTVNSVTTQSTTPTLSGTWNYESGDTLTVTVSGATYTLTPSGNTWTLDLSTATPSSGSLTALTAGQTYDVTATVTRSGVSVSDATTGELTIASGPAVDITGAATASMSSSHPTISGTATAGAVVTLRIDLDNSNTTTNDRVTYSVVADATTGAWSVNTASATPISGTLPTAGLSATVGLLATVTDSSNRTATDTQALTITVPSLSISGVETTYTNGTTGTSSGVTAKVITGDGKLNAYEDDSVAISGSYSGVTSGDQITVQVSDGTTTKSYTYTTSASSGTWTATFNSANSNALSALKDGTLTVTATTGSTTATTSVTHDATAPILAITSPSVLDKTNPTFWVESDLATSSTITLTRSDNVGQTATLTYNSTNERWEGAFGSTNFPNNGPATITASSTASDVAGNEATSVSKSITFSSNPTYPTIAISSITGVTTSAGDTTIVNGEIASGVTISGTLSIPSGSITGTVTVIVTDGTTTVTLTPTAGATWSTSLTKIQMESFKNGPIQITANYSTATDVEVPTLNLTSGTPSITITSPIGDGNLSASEDDSVTISGTSLNAAGSTVSVTVSDGTHTTTASTATVASDGSWTVTGVNLSGLSDGTLTATATVSTASATQNVLHDTSAPVITITPLATSGTPTISGTVTGLSAGSTITVTIDPNNDGSTVSDGLTYLATVKADGSSWSIDTSSATPTSGTFPATGLTAYAKISADASDAAGNAATTAVALDKPIVNSLLTNSTTPTVTGTWASIGGDSLYVVVNGVAYGTSAGQSVTLNGTSYTTVTGLTTGTNSWSLTTGTLSANTYDVKAYAVRGGSQIGDATTGELVVDTTAPAVAITGITNDTGTLTNDFITKDTTLVFSGTAEANSNVLVTLKNASNTTIFAVTVTADGSGNWSVDRTGQTALEQGNYTLTAKATDAAGNQATATQAVVIDLTGPAIGITSNSTTTDTTPLITGTSDLPAGSTITVVVDPDNSSGTTTYTYTATVQNDGTWSVDTGTATPAGQGGPVSYTVGKTLGITATGTDAAGNSADALKNMNIVGSAPSVSITSPLDWNHGNSDGTLNSTEDDAVIIKGGSSGVPNGSTLSIVITDGTTTITDTVTVASDGTWQMSAINLSALRNGTISVSATYVDGNGDSYLANANVNHQKAGTVSIDSISDDTATPGDFITSDRTLVFNGSATAGDTVTVKLDGTTLGTTVADSSGVWSYNYTGHSLADGSYSLTATVGSTIATQSITVDGTAPAGPVTVTALTTNDTTPILTGNATVAAGETLTVTVNGVTYTQGDGNLTVDGTANTWTLAIPNGNALTAANSGFDGIYSVTATLKDTAGNTLSDATSNELKIDTTAPAAPSLSLLASSDSGTSSSDAKTNITTPTIRVTFAGSSLTAPVAGDVVKLYEGSTQVGTATLAGADITAGYVDVTSSTLTAGGKSFTAAITDAAGNTGSASNALAVTLDTTAPALSSAVVSGNTLTLTYTEAGVGMAGTTPSATDFTVTKGSGNTAVSVSSVAVDTTAKTVTLTLGSAITASDSNILLSYTPGSNRVQDVAGNTAASLSAQAVTNSTGAVAPTQTVTIASMTKDSGAADFITNDGSANRSVSGSLSAALGANEVVEVSFDNGGTWTTASTSGTTWSVTDSGSHSADWTLQARVTNSSSHLSGSTASQAVTLDTTAPSAPTVNGLTTASTTPILSGTATVGAGETLTVTVSGATYTVVPSSGTWSLDLATATPTSGSLTALAQGNTYSVTATVTDTAGNATNDATSNELVVAVGPSQAVTIASMTKDSGAADFITNDGSANRSVSGSISAALGANEVVEVSFDNGGTWTIASTGGTTWSVTDSGSHSADWTLQARVTNTATHVSGNTDSQAVTLDTTAPAMPTVDALSTTSTAPTLTGTATVGAGETLTVTVNGATYTVIPSGGTWSLNLATATPASGTLGVFSAGHSYSVTATVTDTAGNATSDATSSELSITSVSAPTAPSQTVTVDLMTRDTGTSATDFITNDGAANRSVSGSISAALGANEVVQVSFDGGTTWVTATTNGTSWSVTDGSSHTSDWNIQARVANTATQLAGTSTARAVTLDTTAPVAPAVDALSTTNVTPSITGSATVGAGEVLSVTIDGVTYTEGDGHLSRNGNSWILGIPANHPLGQGNVYTVTATVTDAAGNRSSATGNVTIGVPQVPLQPSATPVPTPTSAAPLTPPAPAVAPTNPLPPLVPPEVSRADPLVETRTEGGNNISALPAPSNASTGAGGFLVVTAADNGGNQDAALVVVNQPAPQTLETQREANFQLPAGIFRNTDTAARIQVNASMADGSPLPEWLHFDANTGRFTGMAPSGSEGAMDIRLTAKDDRGNAASTQFVVRVGSDGANSSNTPSSGENTVAPLGAPVPAAGGQTSSTGNTGADTTGLNTGNGGTPAPIRESAGTAPNNAFETAIVGLVARTPDLGTGTAAGLSLALRVSDQEAAQGRDFNFQLPNGLFRHTDSAMQVSVEAKLADGKPLPEWLSFNPATGKFEGKVPANQEGTIEVRIIARDANGQEATAQFHINIADMDAARQAAPRADATPERDGATPAKRLSVVGRPALNDQLARHGKAALQRDQQRLVSSLQKLAQHVRRSA